MTSEAWISAGQMNSNVWSALAGMQANELRLFPDGSNTMVVRRGAFRAERPLTLEEARPQLIADLTARQAAEAWDKFLADKAKELGLSE